MKQALAIATAVLAIHALVNASEPRFQTLPPGCKVLRSEVITGIKRDAVAQKLGVPLKALSNTQLSLQDSKLQINILEPSHPEDAPKLHAAISAMKNHPAFCRLRDGKIVEFCKADAAVAVKAAFELGFIEKPEQVTYRLSARIATVRTADYMSFNELCQAFFSADPDRPVPEVTERVAKLSKGFAFGDSLALRLPKDVAYTYRCIPEPIRTERDGKDRIVFSFDQLPKLFDVPFVTLTAVIQCDATGLTPAGRPPDVSLLASTPFWPVSDPEIAALARKITAGMQTPEAKVQAILEWLQPGRNIKVAGPAGSRWGVKKVLEQRFGHCWDSSDCFVTLARAAGVPARQVGGWLFGSSGHIWAEVLLEGKGWQQVDPTGGGRLACGIYHIPYFVTESGDMPILYCSLPQIELSEEHPANPQP